MPLQILMYNSVQVSGSRLPEHLLWQGGSLYMTKAATMHWIAHWKVDHFAELIKSCMTSSELPSPSKSWSFGVWTFLLGSLQRIVRHSATSVSFLYGVLVAAALEDSCYEVSSVDTSWPWEKSGIYFLTCKVDIVQLIQPLSQWSISAMDKLKTIMPLGTVPQACGLGFPPEFAPHCQKHELPCVLLTSSGRAASVVSL